MGLSAPRRTIPPMTHREPTTPPTTSPLLAAAASAILPGAGQWLAGDRRRAVPLLLVDLVIFAVVAFVFRSEVAALTMFVRPTSLAGMMVANILLFGYRVWAADDAYRIAAQRAPRRLPRGVAAVGLVAIGVVLVVPHLVFGYYDVVQYNLITGVFGSTPTASPTTSPATTSPPPTATDGSTPATTPPSSTTSAPRQAAL